MHTSYKKERHIVSVKHFESLLRSKTSFLTFDFDNMKWEDVRNIVEKAVNVTGGCATVWKRGNKHFHVVVEMGKQLPLFVVLLLRLALGDDIYRVRFDTRRLLAGVKRHDILFKVKILVVKVWKWRLLRKRSYTLFATYCNGVWVYEQV